MNQDKVFQYMYQKAFLNRTPISVTIELLTKCNVNCRHCYIPEHKSDGLSYEKVLEIFAQIRELGVINVSLTGGEIFLRKDILNIVEVARSYGFRVFLLSNGTLLNEEIVQKLSKCNVAEFSTTLFSMNPKIHDYITRQTGSHEKLLKNLQCLKKYDIPVKIKMPLMSVNANCIDSVKDYADYNGFEYKVSPIIYPKSDGNSDPTLYRISDRQLSQVLKKTDKIGRISNLQKSDNVPCKALFYAFSIDANGDVYPCNSFFYKVGNIYQNTIQYIWNESEALKTIHSITTEDLFECKNCKVQEFCDRCPGMVWTEKKSLLECDSCAKKFAEIRMKGY